MQQVNIPPPTHYGPLTSFAHNSVHIEFYMLINLRRDQISICGLSLPFFSYRWIRFEVCRPGDGQVPHSLHEDDATVGFESYQRRQVFNEAVKLEHVTGHLIFL